MKIGIVTQWYPPEPAPITGSLAGGDGLSRFQVEASGEDSQPPKDQPLWLAE